MRALKKLSKTYQGYFAQKIFLPRILQKVKQQ